MNLLKILLVSMLLTLVSPQFSHAWFVGPYTGQVVDNQTGKPIEGASVFIYWIENVISVPESHSNLIKAQLVYTNKEGKYKIPFTFLKTSLLGTLDYTHFVVYQPGYVYFSDVFLHGRPSLQQKFTEKDYLIKLDRIPPDFSYKRNWEGLRWAVNEAEDISFLDFSMGPLTSDKLKSKLLKDEFLRRAEWEERRADEEWDRGER